MSIDMVLPGCLQGKIGFAGGVNGCWLWKGRANRRGYGVVQYEVTNDTALVHRVAYEALVSAIPDGLTLDHLCRTKPCVNPTHLEPVTRAENTRRLGETLQFQCSRGHIRSEHGERDSKGKWVCLPCRDMRNKRRFTGPHVSLRRPRLVPVVRTTRRRGHPVPPVGKCTVCKAATQASRYADRRAAGLKLRRNQWVPAIVFPAGNFKNISLDTILGDLIGGAR